jgi:hypothetical protein
MMNSATKQSMSPQAAQWIASRSLSSAHIRATRWLAMTEAMPATNWADGQITKSLSSPSRKNISLNASGKSVI